MVLTQATDFAGTYHPESSPAQLNKATGAAITKGQVIFYDEATDNWKTATTTAGNQRYAVATKDAASAATEVEAVTSGPVSVIADGVIAPHSRVQVSGTTAGQVVAYVPGAAVPNQSVGTYIGKVAANERNGTPVPAAADGDVIIIDLNDGRV